MPPNNRQDKEVQFVIQIWQLLTDAAGFTEAELRAGVADEHRRALLGVDMVCGWFKCATSCGGQVGPEVVLKRCVGCQTTLYCGPLCQKRDWEEGDHKARCMKKPMDV
ncbi:hypothetical protein FRB95_012043 [Tulasnella sp. JGI-2019a]|nr:hypothetical protein FRB93_010504 [Tulasnella sp. JGI-2019a]KAG9024143.1 hypothetical protein FRB95_012043 [Tulasnella sp. JGI-2019a]